MIPQSPFILTLSILLILPLSVSKITFLTNTYPPFSDCTSYPANPISSSVFGAEIELLRSSLTLLNWTEGKNYTFECTASSNLKLFDSFDSSSRVQAGVIGGIAISSTRIEDNLRFSQPTTSASLPLVYRKTAKGWFFRRSLDIMTWGVLLATVIVMGGLLYFLENKEAAYVNMLYNAFCQFFLSPDYPVQYWASKLANYFSTFLVAIMVIMFTAVSTNIFDTDRNFGSSISLDKLADDKVYSNAMLDDYLTQSGVSLTSIDDIDPIDFLNKIDELGVGYLVVDGPYSDYLVRQRCDLYTATNEIDLIHYGVMFHKDFSRDIINQISQGISKAKENKDFSQYVNDYYARKTDIGTCTDKISSTGTTVTLYETRGLWYILFVGMGIGLGFFILNKFGLLVKKNLNIYGLQGVRAKMDGKVQRRVATTLAIHANVSFQAIEFLKKMTHEVLDKTLLVFKVSIGPERLAKAHRKLEKVQEEPLEWSKNYSKDYSSFKDSVSMKASSFIGWLKRATSEKNGLRRSQRSRTGGNIGILNVTKGMTPPTANEANEEGDQKNLTLSLKRESSNSNENGNNLSLESRRKVESPGRGSTFRNAITAMLSRSSMFKAAGEGPHRGSKIGLPRGSTMGVPGASTAKEGMHRGSTMREAMGRGSTMKNGDATPRGSTLKSAGERGLKKLETRRSSYLSQSAKSYKLDKKLTLKLGTLVEKDLDFNQIIAMSSIENNVQSPISSPEGSPKAGKKKEVEDAGKKFRIVAKGLSFVEKMFGKKGMKKNKQMQATANELLAKKEAMLHLELERKKVEVDSRPSVLLSQSSLFLQKKSISPQTSSPRAKNDTLNPSQFKLKHMKHKSSRWGSTGDSPLNRHKNNYSTKNLRGDSRMNVESPENSVRVFNFGFEDYVYAANPNLLPRGVQPKSLSMIGKGDEDYNFGSQNEIDSEMNVCSMSGDLELYNFSQIVKSSPKERRLMKKEIWENL